MKVVMQIVTIGIITLFSGGWIYIIDADQLKFGSRITALRNNRTAVERRKQTGLLLAPPKQHLIPDNQRKSKPSTSSTRRRNDVLESNLTRVSSQTNSRRGAGGRGVEAAVDTIFFGSSKTADIIQRSTTNKPAMQRKTTTKPTTSTTSTTATFINENEIKRQIDFNRIANAGKKSGPIKKYIPPRIDERGRKIKNKSTSKVENGPTKIALNIWSEMFGGYGNGNSSVVRNKTKKAEKDKRASSTNITLRERFNCPRENEVKFDLFPLKCSTDKDCREEICCDIFGAKSCVAGIAKPLEESTHSPIFGLIPRKCPERPLAELWWELKTCRSDSDCWPRVCCPDGRKRYCRTAQPELESVPVPVKRSINYLSEYLECTPAPPPIFDLHPKSCNSTLDCFPNVCCQEAGKKHCRPPKKSVLTLMANVLNVGFIKRLTQNIVIK